MTKYEQVKLEITPHTSTRKTMYICSVCGKLVSDVVTIQGRDKRGRLLDGQHVCLTCKEGTPANGNARVFVRTRKGKA